MFEPDPQAATPLAAEVDGGIWPLLGARVAMGIGEASCLPSLQTIAAKNVPPQVRACLGKSNDTNVGTRHPTTTSTRLTAAINDYK